MWKIRARQYSRSGAIVYGSFGSHSCPGSDADSFYWKPFQGSSDLRMWKAVLIRSQLSWRFRLSAENIEITVLTATPLLRLLHAWRKIFKICVEGACECGEDRRVADVQRNSESFVFVKRSFRNSPSGIEGLADKCCASFCVLVFLVRSAEYVTRKTSASCVNNRHGGDKAICNTR